MQLDDLRDVFSSDKEIHRTVSQYYYETLDSARCGNREVKHPSFETFSWWIIPLVYLLEYSESDVRVKRPKSGVRGITARY